MVMLSGLIKATPGCTCQACRAITDLREVHTKLDLHLADNAARLVAQDPQTYAVLDETFKIIESLLVDATVADLQDDDEMRATPH